MKKNTNSPGRLPAAYIDLTVRVGPSLEDAKPATLKVNSILVKKIARSILQELDFAGSELELSLCLTDDQGIRELNRQYRGKDKATDVLSFPMDEDEFEDGQCAAGGRVLGDVMISVETARVQAGTFGVEFYPEMARLLTHGILHLLGYDHVNGGRQAAKMKREELRIMDALDADLPEL